MRSLIQDKPTYQLSVDIDRIALGHSIKLISFVPTARRPEEQVKFQGVFSTAELEALHDLIHRALTEEAIRITPSANETP